MSQCADDDVYYKNINISFHIIITVGSGNLAHRSDAVYFAELMVVQYACDQLIGIDNANIKECLASDAQNIRMLSKKSINSFEEQFENVHRALLYVKSNYKSLYDFAVVFEEIYKHKRKPFVLKDALEGLPHLVAKKEKGSKGVECAESGFTECDFSYIKNDFYKFINGDKEITKLYNHKNRYNNERDIEIYRRLPQGANSLHESIADIMPYKRRNDIFKDKYFKLDETQICKTITSHMKFDCNMYIHPWDARGLSPREAARIQTFPDDYVITGSQNMWYAQVGNAVPVKLAKAIGDGIMKFIR